MPQYDSCSIESPVLSRVFSFRAGRPDSVLELGHIIFFDSSGREVGRVVHKGFSPAPIRAIVAAAEKAGDYGVMQFGILGEKRVSLFGFLEAVDYAQKTCGVSVR